ncbi:MAG: hypothetical protein L6V93_05815 [Clostridiales bacterium]|nr:MAG: hypothetical protein L6V93_05815 [Clostridiales bacterium]
MRYLKFTRSGISGYTRISEIRVLTDDKTVNTEKFLILMKTRHRLK